MMGRYFRVTQVDSLEEEGPPPSVPGAMPVSRAPGTHLLEACSLALSFWGSSPGRCSGSL